MSGISIESLVMRPWNDSRLTISLLHLFALVPAISAGPPAITLLDTRVISADAQHYHGWPTLARRANGQLLVACSGGREAHICPFGRVDLFVSNDQGETWGWPRTVLDSDMDDRDAGLLETARGTLLVTTFTSLAYEPALARMETVHPENIAVGTLRIRASARQIGKPSSVNG